jgi:hypothetical protein
MTLLELAQALVIQPKCEELYFVGLVPVPERSYYRRVGLEIYKDDLSEAPGHGDFQPVTGDFRARYNRPVRYGISSTSALDRVYQIPDRLSSALCTLPKTQTFCCWTPAQATMSHVFLIYFHSAVALRTGLLQVGA